MDILQLLEQFDGGFTLQNHRAVLKEERLWTARTPSCLTPFAGFVCSVVQRDADDQERGNFMNFIRFCPNILTVEQAPTDNILSGPFV